MISSRFFSKKSSSLFGLFVIHFEKIKKLNKRRFAEKWKNWRLAAFTRRRGLSFDPQEFAFA
jgi:hypothetical protein